MSVHDAVAHSLDVERVVCVCSSFGGIRLETLCPSDRFASAPRTFDMRAVLPAHLRTRKRKRAPRLLARSLRE